jgi:hypothetical protein
MLIRKSRVGLVLVLQVLFFARVSDAMNMPHYDLNSLVYMSTDIVIASLSEDADHKFTATVTETLHGSLHANQQLDTLTPFLTYYRPMEDGMSVVLFLDRRPHQYDFLHTDAAKSPFAIPPSGVYLIDAYQHVHEYFQQNNPGPYVAQGYTYFIRQSVPTKDQDLALPSLAEIKGRITVAIESVQPVRPLLDKVAVPNDAPALIRLVDRTSRSEKDCALRMATAIGDRAMQQIRSLNDPGLLLKAYSIAGPSVPSNSIQFIGSTGGNGGKEFTDARVRYLIRCFSNHRERLALRVAALEILVGLSKWYNASLAPGPSRALLINNSWLGSYATEIQDTSQRIFDDASQSSKLRALCLQFLPLDRLEILADVKSVYGQTASAELRFAIEKAFLSVSDTLYESLNSPGGPVASRLSLAPQCGCTMAAHRSVTFQVEYRERQELVKSLGFIFPQPGLTNLSTGQHFALQDIRTRGGWNGAFDGQFEFDLGTISGLPTGNYSVAPDFVRNQKILSTGYGLKVSIRETPRGKELVIRKAAEN